MLRILHDTKYDFIKWWKTAAILTAAFIALGIGAVAFLGGFQYSIEFTGGTLMQVAFTQDQSSADVAKLRAVLENGGAKGAEIQQFGSARDFTIRAQNAAGSAGAEVTSRAIESDLTKAVGAGAFSIATESAKERFGTVGCWARIDGGGSGSGASYVVGRGPDHRPALHPFYRRPRGFGTYARRTSCL